MSHVWRCGSSPYPCGSHFCCYTLLFKTEEIQRRKTVETEWRKAENDLNRIRGERDNIQQALALRSSKDNAEIIQNHEIRVIANSRKVRGLPLTSGKLYRQSLIFRNCF